MSDNRFRFSKLLCFLILLLQTEALFARSDTKFVLDSLYKEEKKPLDDTVHVGVLIDISYQLNMLRSPDAMEWGQKALNAAQKVGWQKGVARAYTVIGRTLWFRRQFSQAQEMHLKALHIIDQLNDKPWLAITYRDLGKDYGDAGNFPEAMENFTKALKVYQQLQDKDGMAEANTLIAWVYDNQGQYPKAAMHNYVAYKLFEEAGDRSGIAASNASIGNDYESNGEPGKALGYYKRSLSECLKMQEWLAVSDMNSAIGTVYAKLGKYDSALLYLDEGLKYGRSIKNLNCIGSALRRTGDVLFLQQKYTEALNKYNDALKYFVIQKNYRELADLLINKGLCYAYLGSCRQAELALDSCALILAHVAGSAPRIEAWLRAKTVLDSAMGNWKAAYEHGMQAVRIRDSMFNLEGTRNLVQTLMQHEFDKKLALKNKEMEINKLKVAQRKRINQLLIVGLGVLTLAVVFLFIQIKRSGNLRKELQTSLSQKDILIKEIHHRVKNNLQVISSLLRLQAGAITDPAAQTSLTESQNRVLSIALIHQKLYQDDQMDMVDFTTFSSELFEQVKRVFGKGEMPVILFLDKEHMLFPIDTAVPLGLILNELITNSFKYAMGNNKSETFIRVSLAAKDGGYELHYADNGPGLPADIDFGTTRSLGLRLVSRLSKQLNGSARYFKDDGANFVISFPA